MEISSINQCNVSGSKSLERCCHGDTQKGFCLSMEDMKKARGEYMPPVQFKYGRQENRSSYDSVMECCWNSSASSSLCFHTQPTKSTHVNASSGTTECLQVSLFGSISAYYPQTFRPDNLGPSVAVANAQLCNDRLQPCPFFPHISVLPRLCRKCRFIGVLTEPFAVSTRPDVWG